MLSGFNKTPESYRDDFRSAKIGSSDTYQQFAVQLGRLFHHWFDSRGIPRNFDDLREFLIVDQLLSTLPVPLRVHIKEQDKHMLNDIVKMADSWTSAHKGYFKSGPRVPFIAGKNTSQSSSPVVANLWRMRHMRRIERSMMAHCLCAGGDKLMFLNKFNKKIQG